MCFLGPSLLPLAEFSAKVSSHPAHLAGKVAEAQQLDLFLQFFQNASQLLRKLLPQHLHLLLELMDLLCDPSPPPHTHAHSVGDPYGCFSGS